MSESIPEQTFWRANEAAVALSQSLTRIAELEAQKAKYDYSYPPSLVDDIAREGRRVRDAVRFLLSPDAD